MAKLGVVKAPVVRQEEVAKGIYSLVVGIENAADVCPGQFFNIYPKDNAHLLGRPISICDVDIKNNTVRFVYQKKGFGTSEFSGLSAGDTVKVMGPLGNGFPLDMAGGRCVLIGGGMGVAPMLYTARKLGEKAVAVIGYRDETFLAEEFKATGCKVIIATESGSNGIKGNVVDALKSEQITGMPIFTCGPHPMLKAVCEYANLNSMETYISLEERMGCGIGACLGCVTAAKSANDHYQVKKLCICKDGPVFKSTEVEI